MRIPLSLASLLVALLLSAVPAKAEEAFEVEGRRFFLLANATFLTFTDIWKREDQWQGWCEPHLLASWKNGGQKALVAFETVALLYDPYDRLVDGVANTVQAAGGKNFQPLAPGGEGDALLPGAYLDKAFTTVVFVRSARFADGSTWKFDEVAVNKRLLELVPNGPAPASLRLAVSGEPNSKDCR